MDIQVIGAKETTLSVADEVFAVDYNESLIHQVLVVYMTNARQGSRANKNRSAVSGGGAKPWRQKGTGRARAGTSRTPIWRGGGVTFAATNKDYKQKVNKKMYRKAIASIMSELQRKERLHVIDSLQLEQPKTKAISEKLESLKISNVLIVVEDFNKNLLLSVRNLPHVAACSVSEVNPLDLINYDDILFTAPALKLLEERLSL